MIGKTQKERGKNRMENYACCPCHANSYCVIVTRAVLLYCVCNIDREREFVWNFSRKLVRCTSPRKFRCHSNTIQLLCLVQHMPNGKCCINNVDDIFAAEHEQSHLLSTEDDAPQPMPFSCAFRSPQNVETIPM